MARVSLKTDKKMKIAIISLMSALVLVIGAIIGVLAAPQQAINSQFNVLYEIGENVGVAVRTEAYVPGVDTMPAVAEKDKDGNILVNEQGYMVFNTPDAYTSKQGELPKLSISPEHPKAEVIYTIENLRTEGYVQYDLTREFVSKTGGDANIKTTEYYYTGNDADPTKSATTYTSTGWETTNLLNLPGKEITALKVVIEAANPNIEFESQGTLGLKLLYTASPTRDAGTVNKSEFIEETAETTAVVFDSYTSTEAEEYNGVTLGTGTDISVEENGSVNLYNVEGTTYVLSHEPILLPEDSSYMFATETETVVNLSSKPLASTRASKTSITLKNVNTTRVKNMSNMFAGSSVTELDLSSFNTIRVRNMSGMFKDCANLTSIYVEETWITESVSISAEMFAGCVQLNGKPVQNTDKTNANIGSDGYLILIPKPVEKIIAGTLDKNLWRDQLYSNSITSIYFEAYTSVAAEEYVVDGTNVIAGVTGIDISEEQDGSVKLFISDTNAYILAHGKIAFPEDSSSMFFEYYETQHIYCINVDTSNVTNMNSMFMENTVTIIDISGFDTSKVTDMGYMFRDDFECSTIYVGDGWTTENVVSSYDMFSGDENLPNFDSSKRDYTNAHTGTGGYLTYKAN